MDVHKLRSNRPIVAGSGPALHGNFIEAPTTNAPVYTDQTIEGGNAWAKGMDFDDDFDY